MNSIGPIYSPFEVGVREALDKSKGLAFINVGNRNQLEIARSLEGFTVISIDEILNDTADMSKLTLGCVVTGYYAKMYSPRITSNEQLIQMWIRDAFVINKINNSKFQMLILSKSFPNVGVFTNPNNVWYNWMRIGPEHVWFVDVNGSFIQHRLLKTRDEQGKEHVIWTSHEDAQPVQKSLTLTENQPDSTTSVARNEFGLIDQTIPKVFSSKTPNSNEGQS